MLQNNQATISTDLHAKGNHGDEHLKDECQCQLPHGCEDIVTSGAVRQGVAVGLDICRVGIITQLR